MNLIVLGGGGGVEPKTTHLLHVLHIQVMYFPTSRNYKARLIVSSRSSTFPPAPSSRDVMCLAPITSYMYVKRPDPVSPQ